MLRQLDRWFLQDVSALRQSEEKRATALALLRSCVVDFLGVDVNECNRRFRAIELRIAGRYQNDLSISGENLHRLPVPKRAQRAGYLSQGHGLECPVE